MSRIITPAATGPTSATSTSRATLHASGHESGSFDLPWLAGAAWGLLATLALAFAPRPAAWAGLNAALSMHVSILGAGLLAGASALYLALDLAPQAPAWRWASNALWPAVSFMPPVGWITNDAGHVVRRGARASTAQERA